MTLYVMAVGKFYDNFHDLPVTQQNQCNLYKNADGDDPTVCNEAMQSKVSYTLNHWTVIWLDEANCKIDLMSFIKEKCNSEFVNF